MGLYGSPPTNSQVEVAIFGPGRGEAIIAHLGGGDWLLVDSCIHPGSKEPAALYYLRDIGVEVAGVKAIVASHWHDDHVGGMSSLASACPNAEFFLSGVFLEDEAIEIVTAYGGSAAEAQTGGAKELFKSVSVRKDFIPIRQREIVYQGQVGNRQMNVVAFSPTVEGQKQWLLRMAAYIPKTANTSITHAPEMRPNLAAVVLHIDFGDDAVLLGSDLEDHKVGWKAVLSNQWCSNRRKSSAYKVAHHGGKSGDNPGIWSSLLVEDPLAGLTPYSPSGLPTPEDKKRLKSLAAEAYITSATSRRPQIPRDVLKRMQTMGSKFVRIDAGFGGVRFRKKLGGTAWKVETFGTAQKL